MQAYQFVGANTGGRSVPATEVEGWGGAREIGIQYGSASAGNSIVSFIDFTCPYCQRLAPILDSIAEGALGQVEMVFVHFTLDRPLSLRSALAAECANLQGSFRAMASVLYAEIPGKSTEEVDWRSLASDAGLHNLSDFMQCMERPAEDFPRIQAGKEFGRERGVAGTPTVWVNGFRSEARTIESFEASMH
jgi:protein-disulfide isomerase